MDRDQKLVVHGVLLDYNVQLAQIPQESVPPEEQDNVAKAIMGGQLAMMNFVEFLVDPAVRLADGTKLLLGNLLQQNLGFLKEISESALRKGEKLPTQFYERKDIVEGLIKEFPAEEEDKPRIIVP